MSLCIATFPPIIILAKFSNAFMNRDTSPIPEVERTACHCKAVDDYLNLHSKIDYENRNAKIDRPSVAPGIHKSPIFPSPKIGISLLPARLTAVLLLTETMQASRYAFVGIAVFAQLLLACIDRQFCRGESQRLISQTFDLNDFGVGESAANFNLGPINRGEKIRAAVHYRNHSNKEITTLSTSLGCSCISAEVPKVTLAPGESTMLFFNFSVSSSPRSKVVDSFLVDLLTEGGSKFHLNFRGTISNFVSFGTEEFRGILPTDKAYAAYSLPLHVSEGTTAKELKVKLSQELLNAKFESSIQTSGEKFTLLLSSPIAGTSQKDLLGEVSIKRDDSDLTETLFLALRKPKTIEVLPSKIVFLRTEESSSSYRGTCILKFSKEPSMPLDVALFDKKNRSVSHTMSKVSTTIYRVFVTAERVNLEEKNAQDQVIDFTVTSAGVRTVLKLNFAFAN